MSFILTGVYCIQIILKMKKNNKPTFKKFKYHNLRV